MSNKLIKTFETPTDFTICVYQNQKNGRFAVTTYDNVSEKHDDVKWYQNAEEAMSDAEYRSGQYDLNEGVKTKQTIRLNESQLRQVVTEAVKRLLSEDVKKNVTRIRITGLADMGRNKELIMDKLLMLRHARNVGDEENVNHTVLGALRRYGNYIQFEII